MSALVNITPTPVQRFVDTNGNALAGGKLFTYQAGTSTKVATYTDSTGNTPNTNPIVLNQRGEASIWLLPTQSYKFVLSPSNDTDPPTSPIWTQDNVIAPAPVAVGNMTVENGSGGTPGFKSGVDFTGGTTTSLTLSGTYGSASNITVHFDAAYQGPDQYTLTGNTLTFNSPIPVGTNTVYVVGGTTLSVGVPATSSVLDSMVATNSKLYNRINDVVYVKDPAFGAKGDGTTNDTAAITAADAFARSIGAQLYFPAGTYMVSQIVLYSGSNWKGDGRNATTIKQIVGSNTDLIYGNNSNSNWGTSNPSNIVVGWTMEGITLNGNWNSGSGNNQGSGLAVYGCRPIMRDIFITNVAEHGMRTEYLAVANGPGLDTFAMEGHLENIRIDTVGKHGWWNNGPNDTITVGMIVVDAGQAAANTYDGFHFDKQSTGHNMGLHAWTRSSSLRMSYALQLLAGAQHEFSGGCNFEGAWNGNVGIFTQACIFDASTKYYAAWNGVNIFMGKTATVNILKGWLGPPGAGRPACIGLLLGSVAGDFIGNNNIELFMNQQEASNVTFTSYDGGNNIIRVNAYNTTAASYGGAPAVTDDFEIRVQNSGGTSVISNRHQKTSLSIGGSASATWTFPFPFNGNPNLSGMAIGAAGGGFWVTSLSTTAVTVFNNTGTGITLSLNADAVN